MPASGVSSPSAWNHRPIRTDSLFLVIPRPSIGTVLGESMISAFTHSSISSQKPRTRAGLGADPRTRQLRSLFFRRSARKGNDRCKGTIGLDARHQFVTQFPGDYFAQSDITETDPGRRL